MDLCIQSPQIQFGQSFLTHHCRGKGEERGRRGEGEERGEERGRRGERGGGGEGERGEEEKSERKRTGEGNLNRCFTALVMHH